MQAGSIIDIMAAIVTVGLITVLVTKPNTAKVIETGGKAFIGSLKAAMGN